MLPQEIKEMPADRQLLFVEHVLPVKCQKIKYFEDKIFAARLLPSPGVKKQDVSKYTGGRTDDHFAMWQERVNRGQRAAAPRSEAVTNGPPPTHEAAAAALSPAAEFSLDFSTIQIPQGRYLTGSELDAAVNAFVDELESI
jgi:type IV secretory pathway TraG/TraD family ATPase VirD4